VGNRTNSNQNGASVFNQANQLTENGNFTYQYDNNGNLTRKTSKTGGPLTSYEYDAENKLARAVVNGTTANYKYDGLGRRVEKEVISVSTTVTRYIYDNEDILLELDSSNNITARYTHGPGIDEPLIMERGGQSFFYHADGLGSITEISNQAGTVVQSYTYSSFGKIESQLDPSFVQPYAFTAREFDPETGLYFYRSRTLDPLTGRFLQEDPFGGISTLPQSLNVYPYVVNNPLTFVDPTGEILIRIKQLLKQAFKDPMNRYELIGDVAGSLLGITVGPLGLAASILLYPFVEPSDVGVNDATELYLIRSRRGDFNKILPYSRDLLLEQIRRTLEQEGNVCPLTGLQIRQTPEQFFPSVRR